MAAPIFSEGDESTNEERLNYMYLNLVGQTVIAHTADGAKVEGLFVSADDDSGDVILGKARYKTSKIHKGKDNANFSDRLLIPAGSLMMIEAVEVNFRTQGVARGNVDHLRRGMEPMTKWSEVTDDPGEGLEEEPHRPGQWDQFKANKEKFGVQSTYVEEEYTTKLDKSKMTRKQHVEAERIEREIMNAAVKGVQHQIERSGDGEGQYDEGELFSDVLPSDKKGGGRRGGDAAPPPPPKVTEGAPAAKSGGPPGSRYIPPAERKRLEAAGQWPPKDVEGGSSPTDQAEPPQLTTTAKNAPSHIDPAIVADTSNNNATGAQADSAPNSQQKGQLNPGARAFTPGVSLAAHDTQLAPSVADQKPKAASSADKAKPSSSAPTTAASATGASAKAGFFVSDMLGSIASVLQRRLDAGEFSAPQPTYEWQGDEAFTSDANAAAFIPQHGGPHAHHGGGLGHHHHGGHPHGMHGGGGFAQQNMMMGGGGPHAHHNVHHSHHSHHGGHHHHGGGHGMHGGGFQGGMGGGGGFGGQGGFQGYDQQGGQFAGGGHQNFNNFGDQFAGGGGQPGFGGAAFSNSNPHHHQGGGGNFSGGGNFAGGSGGFTSPNSTQQHQHHHAHQYSQQQQMMGGGGGGFGGQGGAGSSSTGGGGGFGRGGGTGMGRGGGGGGHAQPQQPVSSGMMEPPATGGGNGSGGGSPTIPRPASESRGGGGMAPRGGGMRGRGRGAGGGGAQDEQPHQPQQQQQGNNGNGTLIGANVATNAKPKRGGR